MVLDKKINIEYVYTAIKSNFLKCFSTFKVEDQIHFLKGQKTINRLTLHLYFTKILLKDKLHLQLHIP